ncbi:MAG: hypothetical protein FWE09_09415, partial [Treponema sp.]|nr:hypothetical protein [Treponema sp.]
GSDILPNDPAEENAVILMAERGLDISAHIAVQWTHEMLGAADIVLTATGGHRNRINVPTLGIYASKVFLFREFVGDSGSVPDPFEEPMEVYIEVAAVITDAVEKLLAQISNAQRPQLRGVSANGTGLSVAASSPDGGRLSYQWFASEDGGNSGGIVVPGATGSVFEPEGPGMYYVEVTNTNISAKPGIKVDAWGKPYATRAVTASEVVTVRSGN